MYHNPFVRATAHAEEYKRSSPHSRANQSADIGEVSRLNNGIQSTQNGYYSDCHGTNHGFEQPDNLDAESSITFISKLKIITHAKGGERSITQILFRDARDIKCKDWKVIHPISSTNQWRRVAAAISILCEEAVDETGSRLPEQSASNICEMLLKSMTRDQALRAVSSLYKLYGNAKPNTYLSNGRRKLRAWLDRNVSIMSGQKYSYRSRNGILVRLSFC
jgi:hypothetical protein